MVKLRESDIIKPEQINEIFLNIEDIEKVTEELTYKLEERIEPEWDESMGISDIFIDIVKKKK